MGYAKLFSSITESSLWCESKDTRLVFITLLAKADATGFVEASVPGLSRAANLHVDETRAALRVLESPDPESKDLSDFPQNEGRRILQVSGGWMIVNYSVYRDRKNEDQRREYMRAYMRDYRQNRKQPSTQNANTLADVNKNANGKPQAEAEAEAEASSSMERERQIRIVVDGMGMDDDGLKKILKRSDVFAAHVLMVVEQVKAMKEKATNPPGLIIQKISSEKFHPTKTISATTICRWNREGKLASVYRMSLQATTKLGHKSTGALVTEAGERRKELLDPAGIIFKGIA